MRKPVLLIMAAGMGSRYGGLKQMDPVDDEGHLIIDFSLYDARLAGFEEVIFVIKRENEELFRERIGNRIEKLMKVHYVHQELSDLPEGFSVPEGRAKPWGTGHAVLSAIYTINEAPFAVINADDYYGRDAFRLIFEFLSREHSDGRKLLKKKEHRPDFDEIVNALEHEKLHFAMVAYEVGKTVTEHGSVARGVCKVDEHGYLSEIKERTHIEKRENGAAFTEDGGASWNFLPADTPVSMNFWGFTYEMVDALQERFVKFLQDEMPNNPEKAEYFLPFVVEALLLEGKADVEVLHTPDRWHGVTYQADKPAVEEAIRTLKSEGQYPEGFAD